MKKLILAMAMVVAMATGAVAAGYDYIEPTRCDVSNCSPDFYSPGPLRCEISDCTIIPPETPVDSLNRSLSQPAYAVVSIAAAPFHLLAVPYKALQTVPYFGNWADLLRVPFEIPAAILAAPMLGIEYLAQ